MRRSKRIRKTSKGYEPGFGATRDWKSDNVASIVYMIQDGGLNKFITQMRSYRYCLNEMQIILWMRHQHFI